MKDIVDSRCVIQKNAQRIRELRDRIRTGDNWPHCVVDFHSQYDALAFPGGYSEGLRKIRAGDVSAIEAALAFLEVRPYFFRSQYIQTKLKRLLKHAPLTARQAERFQKNIAGRQEEENKCLIRRPNDSGYGETLQATSIGWCGFPVWR